MLDLSQRGVFVELLKTAAAAAASEEGSNGPETVFSKTVLSNPVERTVFHCF